MTLAPTSIWFTLLIMTAALLCNPADAQTTTLRFGNPAVAAGVDHHVDWTGVGLALANTTTQTTSSVISVPATNGVPAFQFKITLTSMDPTENLSSRSSGGKTFVRSGGSNFNNPGDGVRATVDVLSRGVTFDGFTLTSFGNMGTEPSIINGQSFASGNNFDLTNTDNFPDGIQTTYTVQVPAAGGTYDQGVLDLRFSYTPDKKVKVILGNPNYTFLDHGVDLSLGWDEIGLTFGSTQIISSAVSVPATNGLAAFQFNVTLTSATSKTVKTRTSSPKTFVGAGSTSSTFNGDGDGLSVSVTKTAEANVGFDGFTYCTIGKTTGAEDVVISDVLFLDGSAFDLTDTNHFPGGVPTAFSIDVPIGGQGGSYDLNELRFEFGYRPAGTVIAIQ